MSAVLPGHTAGHGHDEAHAHPHGWQRWLFATNHKDIGTLYLLFSLTMLMVGGVLALGIRAELFKPGLQVLNPELFNQLTTMHGLIMVFGAISQGAKAPQKPWDAAEGLEWEVPSPALFHTFENPPKLNAAATRVLG